MTTAFSGARGEKIDISLSRWLLSQRSLPHRAAFLVFGGIQPQVEGRKPKKLRQNCGGEENNASAAYSKYYLTQPVGRQIQIIDYFCCGVNCMHGQTEKKETTFLSSPSSSPPPLDPEFICDRISCGEQRHDNNKRP